jgi:hypothetical protein
MSNHQPRRQGPPAGGPGGPKMVGKPASVDKKTVKRLLAYFSKYKLRMLLVFVFIITSSVASVMASIFLQTLIDG